MCSSRLCTTRSPLATLTARSDESLNVCGRSLYHCCSPRSVGVVAACAMEGGVTTSSPNTKTASMVSTLPHVRLECDVLVRDPSTTDSSGGRVSPVRRTRSIAYLLQEPTVPRASSAGHIWEPRQHARTSSKKL